MGLYECVLHSFMFINNNILLYVKMLEHFNKTQTWEPQHNDIEVQITVRCSVKSRSLEQWYVYSRNNCQQWLL